MNIWLVRDTVRKKVRITSVFEIIGTGDQLPTNAEGPHRFQQARVGPVASTEIYFGGKKNQGISLGALFK